MLHCVALFFLVEKCYKLLFSFCGMYNIHEAAKPYTQIQSYPYSLHAPICTSLIGEPSPTAKPASFLEL